MPLPSSLTVIEQYSPGAHSSSPPQSIMPALSSDVIACVVKLMSNDELMNTFGPVFGFPTTLLIDPNEPFEGTLTAPVRTQYRRP